MRQKRWAPYMEPLIHVTDADVVVVAGSQYILKTNYMKFF